MEFRPSGASAISLPTECESIDALHVDGVGAGASAGRDDDSTAARRASARGRPTSVEADQLLFLSRGR